MPFTPTKPTQAQRTAYSITVTWQPTGNHSIDSYTLYYREKSASKWILVKDIRGRTSTTLDNLEPYTTYQFRVFAVNNIGLSKPSPLAEMTTLEKGMSLFKVFLFSVKFFWKGTGSREGFPQHDWYIYKRQMILTKKQSRRQFFFRISDQFLKTGRDFKPTQATRGEACALTVHYPYLWY